MYAGAEVIFEGILKMLKQTIVKVTTADTRNTYTFIDGKPTEGTPQLWMFNCKLTLVQHPNDIPNDTVGEHILIVERQSLVDCGRLGVARNDTPPPEPRRDIYELLVTALRNAGVLKHVEEAILQSQESSDE